ncbi:unnamed protein product, partial [marine sediment metagenome]
DEDVPLAVAPPGVLGNDTDANGDALSSVFVPGSGPVNGDAVLNADGSFTYTPDPQFFGADSFTYRASDGVLESGDTVVQLTVNPTGSQAFIDANFDVDEDLFGYADDVFRGTSAPTYADGARLPAGGFAGGGLQVLVGGVDGADIFGMSGAWERTFNLAVPAKVMVSVRYNLTQTGTYEADEFSQALLAVDGTLYGNGPADSLVQITGDGNTGPALTSGWQQFEVNLGELPAGDHTVSIGAYNNKKTFTNESTEALIDDVLVAEAPNAAPGRQR